MFPALSLASATLAARPLRRLGAVLVLLASLGTLLLVDARPAAAALVHGERVSFESQNFPGRYIRHRHWLGELTPLATDLDRNDATFIVHNPGLTGDAGTVSFESANIRGHFLRHHYFRMKLHRDDNSNTALFKQDATFKALPLPNDEWRFESVNIGGHFIRHRNFELWLDRADDRAPLPFDWDSSWRRKQPANTPGLCPGADTPVNPNTAPVAEAAITCLTNNERRKAGRAALAVNATLQGTARAHSQDMVRRRFQDHINPDRMNECQRMTAAGYHWSWCGENIYSEAPTATARGFVHWWMNSPAHRDNILNANFTEIGVGVAPGTYSGGPGSAGGTGTQNFGRPR